MYTLKVLLRLPMILLLALLFVVTYFVVMLKVRFLEFWGLT
jgi:hypothetical protein